jgi:hypothetical protein
MGQEAEWGNVQPFTFEGIKAAIEYVQSFDIPDVELLLPNKKPAIITGDLGVPVHFAPWLPADCAVAVPKDRDFLGFMCHVKTSVVAVVHNASRGIAIARGSPCP